MQRKFQNINLMTNLSTPTNVHSLRSRFLLYVLIQLLVIEKHNEARHDNTRDLQMKKVSCLCHPPHAHKSILHTLIAQHTRAQEKLSYHIQGKRKCSQNFQFVKNRDCALTFTQTKDETLWMCIGFAFQTRPQNEKYGNHQ